MLMSCNLIPPAELTAHCLKLLAQIASCQVANRPGRLEPRVLKRDGSREKFLMTYNPGGYLRRKS